MVFDFRLSRLGEYLWALRPHIVLMSIPCWFMGISLAYNQGYFNFINAILTLIGALLLHLSVNAFNEVFDYLRGNDTIENVSEYSGGGGYLVKGLVSPFEMGTFAFILFLLGCSIGVYIGLTHKIVFIIGFIGSIMILLYTPLLKPLGLGEVAMIIGFSMISLGSYISMFEPEKYIFNFHTFLLFLLPGLWKSTVLVINEFPDYENDKKANVKNWIVRFGRKRTALIYLLMMAIFYLLILYLCFVKFLSFGAMVSLITLPWAIKNFLSSFNYKDLKTHIPVMRCQVKLGYISLGIIALSLVIL